MLHATSCKEYPHSFICKSHGKQEVDVQSFLAVEIEICYKSVNGRTNGRTD